jgi:hypothetical protein
MSDRALSDLSVGIFLPKPETRATDISARLIRLRLAIVQRRNGSCLLLETSICNPAASFGWSGFFYLDSL